MVCVVYTGVRSIMRIIMIIMIDMINVNIYLMGILFIENEMNRAVGHLCAHIG